MVHLELLDRDLPPRPVASESETGLPERLEAGFVTERARHDISQARDVAFRHQKRGLPADLGHGARVVAGDDAATRLRFQDVAPKLLGPRRGGPA